MKITIRAANIDDMPQVHELVKELAIYEKAGHEVTTTAADYVNDFTEGLFEVLLATTEGEIVGIMLYYTTYSTWKGKMIYLEDFVVKKSYRELGVGQQLYDHFIDIVKGKGAKLAKWQVLDWNKPAINFYKKNNAHIEQNWWNVKVFIQQ